MNVFEAIDIVIRRPELEGGVEKPVFVSTAPTLTSATIPAAGNSISLLFDETVSIGAGGNGGWTITMTGGAATMTYASGDGTDTLVYTLSATINSAETGTVSYTQPGNGIEDDAGNDLANVSSAAVTNSSTQYNSGFTADSNLAALYRLENGALTTDSKGTNTLTNVNTIVADTVNFKQGAASADLEAGSSQSFNIHDASLSADYPLKYGTANRSISVSFWIKPESFPASDGLFWIYSKWEGEIRSFGVMLWNNAGNTIVEMNVGFNGGADSEFLDHASALSAATWYHLTVSYDDSNKAVAIRVRDTSGNVVGTDATGTLTLDANKISLTEATVVIGSYDHGYEAQFYDGLIDEMAIFKDVLSAAEATAIAKGIYR